MQPQEKKMKTLRKKIILVLQANLIMNSPSVFNQVRQSHFLFNFDKIQTVVKEINQTIKSIIREIIFNNFPHNSYKIKYKN